MNLKIFHQVESVVRSKFTTAQAPQVQLIQIQVELLKLQDALETIHNTKAVLLSQLRNHLGGMDFTPPEFEMTIDYGEDLVFESLTTLENNPRHLISEIKVKLSEEGVQLSSLASLPDIAIGVDYISLGGDAGDNPLMGMLGLSIPVWLGKNKASRESSKAKLSSARHLQVDTANQLSTQQDDLEFTLEDNQRKYYLYRDKLIPLAEQSYQTSEAAYLTDKLDFATYLEAERSLLSLRLSAAKARSEFYIAQAKYDELSGRSKEELP